VPPSRYIFGTLYTKEFGSRFYWTSKIIRSAKTSIVLIDNYVDETTLTHLAKKAKGVKVTLLSKTIGKQLKLDVQKQILNTAILKQKNLPKATTAF